MTLCKRRQLVREARTVRLMIELHCRDRHATGREICADCSRLLAYALGRLDACRFGEKKPVCAACTVHCFRPSMRENIREVMRYSGPRMLYRHPALALAHLAGRRRRPPEL
jgi:hypothetical protein